MKYGKKWYFPLSKVYLPRLDLMEICNFSAIVKKLPKKVNALNRAQEYTFFGLRARKALNLSANDKFTVTNSEGTN